MIIIIFDFFFVLLGFGVVGTLWGMHGMGRGTGKRTEEEAASGKKKKNTEFFPAMDGNQQQLLLLLFNEARARLLGEDTTAAAVDNPSANSATQINPSILVIIIILTIIFFLSCCLHILIRYSVRGPRRDPSALVTLTALQGQLQQLFHLHDSGVEQAFIDTLPVFFYKSVTGLKEGADCAVCLCEFEPDDRLRLLPKCSHAFHIDCIDTWLLSHSTCPLCRRSLLPDGWNLPPLSQEPLFLESNRHDTGVTLPDDAAETGRQNASHPVIVSPDALKIPETGRLLPVQLGKFKASQNLDSSDAPTGENTSASSIARRAYSFGSYEYIVDSSNSTHVFIAPTPSRRRTSTPRPTTPGHRTTLSDSTPDHEHACSSSNSHYYNQLNTPIMTPYHPFLNNLFPLCRPAAVEASTSTSKHPLCNPNSSFSIDIEEEQQQQQHAAAPPRLSLCADVGVIRNQVAGSFRKSVQRNSFRLATATLQQDATPAARRAVSFRLPPITDAQLKVSASRRSHSETELPELIKGAHHNNPSDQATIIHQASTINSSAIGANILSGGSSGSARVSSFARKTINWLVGRQKRVIHASTSSAQMDPK